MIIWTNYCTHKPQCKCMSMCGLQSANCIHSNKTELYLFVFTCFTLVIDISYMYMFFQSGAFQNYSGSMGASRLLAGLSSAILVRVVDLSMGWTSSKLKLGERFFLKGLGERVRAFGVFDDW